MTITVLWWHLPLLVTAIWVVAGVWGWLKPGGMWEAMAYGINMTLLAIPVLLAWIVAMAWRIAA